MREELGHLRTANAPGKPSKVKIPPVTPAMADNIFQLKWYCRTGAWPRGAHVRQQCRRSLNPLSSMKTMVRPSFLAFFLTPASGPASTAESSFRPAPRRVPSAVGNSSPVAAGSATPASGGTSPRIRAQSGGLPATTSTSWFHSPAPAARVSAPVRCAAGLPDADGACARLVPPSSAHAVHLAPVAVPTDLPTADAPAPAGPPPTDCIPASAVALLPSAAVPVPQNLCELPLDCPYGHSTTKPNKCQYIIQYSIVTLLGSL
jgi:hypothetical protein